MEAVRRAQDWIKENAPMLAGIYENKYVGMVYDRFASLPPKQQKEVILGFLGTIVLVVVGFLFVSYLSLWNDSDKLEQARDMESLILKYQKELRDKGPLLENLEKNAALTNPGQFKDLLVAEARNAQISPRLIEAEEKPDGTSREEGGTDVKLRQATVTLQRVNLAQLKTFLSNIELGQRNLSVSSIKITNDDKLRGYMKVELGVVAYVFQSGAAQ